MAEIKKEVDIEVEITARCYVCGNELDLSSEDVDSWGDIKVTVKPCDCQLDDKEK